MPTNIPKVFARREKHRQMYRTETDYGNEMKRGTEKSVMDKYQTPEFNRVRPYKHESYGNMFYAEIPPYGIDSFYGDFDMMVRTGIGPNISEQPTTVRRKVPKPIFTPLSGVVDNTVVITCSDPLARLYYTYTISNTTEDNMTKYESPITITESEDDPKIIYAKAFR